MEVAESGVGVRRIERPEADRSLPVASRPVELNLYFDVGDGFPPFPPLADCAAILREVARRVGGKADGGKATLPKVVVVGQRCFE